MNNFEKLIERPFNNLVDSYSIPEFNTPEIVKLRFQIYELDGKISAMNHLRNVYENERNVFKKASVLTEATKDYDKIMNERQKLIDELTEKAKPLMEAATSNENPTQPGGSKKKTRRRKNRSTRKVSK